MADQFSPEEVRKIKQLIGSPLKKRTTHVIRVLDESGSMITGRDITISSYNEMQQTAKMAATEDHSVLVTLVKFNHEASIISNRAPVAAATPLSTDNFIPGGSTALFDAIGLAIDTAQKYPQDADTAFLLQIFTDGEENASTKYTADRLKSIISELNASGKWTITVAGPKGNIDLFTRYLGVPLGNVTSFDPTSVQSRFKNAGMMANATANYFVGRAAGQTAVMDSYSSVSEEQLKAWEDTTTVNNGNDSTTANAVNLSSAAPTAAWPFPTSNKTSEKTEGTGSA